MSNNKQTMKLYTEEQVREAMGFARGHHRMSDTQFIDTLTPIELPSDEEIIHSASDWVFRKNPTKWSVNDDTAGDNMGSFLNGAKWMRDKIQGGNK